MIRDPDESDEGRLFGRDSAPFAEMFSEKGEFQFLVRGIPLGHRQPSSPDAVGFIDSGTTARHPQLDGLVLGERTFVDGPIHDELGHGTWVMLAFLASSPAARGYSMYSAKVTRDGNGLTARNVTAAFHWLVSKKVRIINIGLGFTKLTDDVRRLCEAIKSQDSILVCAAAGNDGPGVKVYPAHCEGVIAVGEAQNDGHASPTSGPGGVYATPPQLMARWAYLNDLASQEARAGDLKLAKAHFQESLAASDNPEAHFQLALIAFHDGDLQGARASAERTVLLAPAVSEYWQTLGGIQLSQGDSQGAAPSLERALELDPKNQRALMNLARTYASLGDMSLASSTLDRAQANEPTDPRIGALRETFAAAQSPAKGV